MDLLLKIDSFEYHVTLGEGKSKTSCDIVIFHVHPFENPCDPFREGPDRPNPKKTYHHGKKVPPVTRPFTKKSWKSLAVKYYFNGLSKKTQILVVIYNQQFQGTTILLMVFDFQGDA